MTTVISIERPDSADARALIAELDAYLEPLYPSESRHGYSVDKLLRNDVAFFLVRDDGAPVGCGGIQLYGCDYGELKRMYVRPHCRGRGFGKQLLGALAAHARGHDVAVLRLETGIHQHEAIGLYESSGFREIPHFGEYRDDPLSRFYERRIRLRADDVVTTARARMDPIQARDAGELLTVFHDQGVRRFLLDDTLVSPEWVSNEIATSEARFAQSGTGIWAIRLAAEERIIGFVGFREFFEPPVLQLLYGLLPTHWHRGLATEAARAACDHGFGQLGFASVRASIDVPNVASRKVLERLGMRYEKTTDQGLAGIAFYVLDGAVATSALGSTVR